DSLGGPRRRHLARPQAIGDVTGDGEVGEHRIVLEHHADVAQMRRQPVDPPVGEADLAGIELAEARDHAQQRGLAAARWPQQREELALADVEIDGAHTAEAARCARNRDAAHGVSPPPSPGEVSASYADGGGVTHHPRCLPPPSRITATPPPKTGEGRFRPFTVTPG